MIYHEVCQVFVNKHKMKKILHICANSIFTQLAETAPRFSDKKILIFNKQQHNANDSNISNRHSVRAFQAKQHKGSMLKNICTSKCVIFDVDENSIKAFGRCHESHKFGSPCFWLNLF